MLLRKGGDAYDWFVLALCIRRKGDNEKAREWFDKAVDWTKKNKPRDRELRQLRAETGELMAHDSLTKRWLDVLKGTDRPRDTAEWIAFAEFAYERAHFAAAARFWGEAFAADPTRGIGRDSQHRYDAACAAALAAAGKGKDDPPPDADTKNRLRSQSLDWLKSELGEWGKVAASGAPHSGETLVENLQRWKNDLDLAGIRDLADLAKLPPVEQKPWTALWAEVDALLKRTETQAQLAVVVPRNPRTKPQQPTSAAREPTQLVDATQKSRGVEATRPADPEVTMKSEDPPAEAKAAVQPKRAAPRKNTSAVFDRKRRASSRKR